MSRVTSLQAYASENVTFAVCRRAGERLKATRERLGFTRDEVAQHAGRCLYEVEAAEAGRASLDAYVDLALALEWIPEDLFVPDRELERRSLGPLYE
jgi:transcriptional regulator with XRE-family HTH domain